MRNINNKNTKKVLLIEIEKMVFFEKKPFFLLPLKLIKIGVSNVT